MEQQQGREGPVTRCGTGAQQSCSSWPLDDQALVSWPCTDAREAWVSSAILNASLYPGVWEVVATWCLIGGRRGEGRRSNFQRYFSMPTPSWGQERKVDFFVQHPRIHLGDEVGPGLNGLLSPGSTIFEGKEHFSRLAGSQALLPLTDPTISIRIPGEEPAGLRCLD